MRKHRSWSSAQVAQFTKLCRAGLPRDVIAERMGVTLMRIYTLYYPMRRGGRIDCALAPRRRLNRPLHGRQDEVRLLSKAGMSAAGIARKFGLSRGRVKAFMSYHGLYAIDRRRGFGNQQRPGYGLPVNVARLVLPDVSDADVKLARRVWAELDERAA